MARCFLGPCRQQSQLTSQALPFGLLLCAQSASLSYFVSFIQIALLITLENHPVLFPPLPALSLPMVGRPQSYFSQLVSLPRVQGPQRVNSDLKRSLFVYY